MKKGILYVFAAVALLVAASCSSDDPAPAIQFATSPDASSDHDDKSGGVYKGTFANGTTSGNIKITLQGGTTNVILGYNGVTKTLTTTDLASWTSGDTTSAVFTNGDWSVLFVSSGDGTNFGLGLSLGGVTNFEGVIVKEKSTALVRIYEGTYAGDASGKWNFATQGNALAGFYTGSGTGYLDGTVAGSGITLFESGGTVTAVGTFANEARDCSGSWENGSDAGTWTGARKI